MANKTGRTGKAHTFADDRGRVCNGSCGQYKTWENYHKNTRRKFGHEARCKSCRNSPEKSRKNNLVRKRKVMDGYGGACACCGETELAFLTIDHINNDGAEHRRLLGNNGASQMYAWVLKNNFPPGLQVLCANCNLGKLANKGICPHQEFDIGKMLE